MIVGGKHAVAEGCLVQPLLDQAEGVAALNRVGWWCRGYGSASAQPRDPDTLAEGEPCWVAWHPADCILLTA